MSEFELIDKRREPSGFLRIRYGSSIEDPSYVAHADYRRRTEKSRITPNDMPRSSRP
jgi:hypothetical protein